MKSPPDITVLLTSYNNAPELRQTLEGFCCTNRSGLELEFVTVDNNSSDDTRSVIESFNRRLPVRYLHEPRKGKCAALNHALNALTPGRIVFFTDDDVDVPSDLFQEVAAVTGRNPSCGVFGGQVHLVWPPGPVPAWARTLAASFKAYSHLDLGPVERDFPGQETPVGTNWWVRGEVLKPDYRFDERIGPGAPLCNMGDETAFLLRLRRDGYTIKYAPQVRIGHRVSQRLLKKDVITRRGLSAGVAGAFLAYECGFGPKPTIENRLGWSLLKAASLLRWTLLYAAAFLSREKSSQMLRRWDAMQGVGWNWEALRLALSRRRPEPAALNAQPAGIRMS